MNGRLASGWRYCEAHVNPVDYGDVQGLAMFGYGKLTEACYLLLRVRDADAARTWIASTHFTTAEPLPTAPDTAIQIAFTPSGLRALGVPESAIAGFSSEFLGGMAGPGSRSRRLGDTGKSDPSQWWWGGSDHVPDVVVMLFAKQNLDGWKQAVQKAPWDAAFEILQTLPTSNMGGQEPFGFADGISQPAFDWKREYTPPGNTIAYGNRVALGELLLGYPNEYGKYTDRPLVNPTTPAADELLPAEDQPDRKDLGLNGTFFVLRQLEQDVRGFWQYLASVAEGDADERYRLGTAMVGRNLNGDPLIPPSGETIAAVTDKVGEPRNAFTYDHDPAGTACPFGAHIRRANPRNADLFGHPNEPVAVVASKLALPRPRPADDLMASTRFHRVFRRGREYGPRLTPEEALQPATAGEEPRGLQFACLVANIGRQFEFVQNAWLMSTKFDGLTEESDPLLGNREAVGDCPVTGNFSIPRDGKVARRLTGIPQFVTVRGGAYFFLPSLRAIRYVARAGKAGSARQE
jgi:deferrochelatase/peroxidase EfeB